MKVYVVWFQDPIEPVAGLEAIFANREDAEKHCGECIKEDEFGAWFYVDEVEVR